MTLRDKFSKLIPFYSVKDNYAKSIECEKISDDYAIEFAEFVQFNSELWISHSRKQLLEIFKKEKGL